MKKIVYLVLILTIFICPFVYVNAEDPVVTPTPIQTPDPVKEDSSLASLSVTVDGSVASLQPAFSKDVKSYKIIVKSSITSISLAAEATASDSTIDNTQLGTKELKEGSNEFIIKVVAKDNTTSEYKVEVVRATSNLKLSRLVLQGTKLNEIFNPDNNEYTCDVANAITKVNVNVVKDANTRYTVSGNSNLKVGKNIVTVTVQNEANESNTYKIVVTRATEEVVGDDDGDDNTSEELSTSDSDEITKTINSNDRNNNKADEGASKTRSIIIIILSVLSLLIAGFGIFFFIRTSNSEKNKQKRIAKLKKKQQKIEEQLTGLIPVIKEEPLKEKEPVKETKPVIDDVLDDEEFEKTIEIKNLNKNIESTRSSRMERRVQENYNEFDDLFDDRDL